MQFLAGFRHSANKIDYIVSTLSKTHIKVTHTGAIVKIKGVVTAAHLNQIKGRAGCQRVSRGQHNLKADGAAAVKLEVPRIECELVKVAVQKHPQGGTAFDGKCLQTGEGHAVRATAIAQMHRAAAIDREGIRAAAKIRCSQTHHTAIMHHHSLSTAVHIKSTSRRATAKVRGGIIIRRAIGKHNITRRHRATIEIDGGITFNGNSTALVVVSLANDDIPRIGDGHIAPCARNRNTTTASAIVRIRTKRDIATIGHSDISIIIIIISSENEHTKILNTAVGGARIANIATVGDGHSRTFAINTIPTRPGKNSAKPVVVRTTALGMNNIGTIVNGDRFSTNHSQRRAVVNGTLNIALGGGVGLHIDSQIARHP